MTYLEFIERAHQLLGGEIERHPIEIAGSRWEKERYKGDLEEEYIYVKWVSSSMVGGNCWDDNEPYFREGEEEPKFEALDKLIGEIYPELSYKNFQELEKKVVEGTYTENEYYGNSTTYSLKRIKLRDIYEVLET
jgi:hypothetical protein